MTKPRVRFAPSPTGFLHIGAIRSTLFNYLYARQTDGKFILRLEDTDRERYVKEAEAHMIASLEWLGLSPDEGFGTNRGEYGPYIQSQRLHLYKKEADKLVETGDLYPCWCSPERLTKLREEYQQKHEAFKYDRYCLRHPQSLSESHVLRFKIPESQEVIWQDAVKGEVRFKTSDLDDFVCIKSDGFPTYQFANVVDDHLMKITHVLRADEWVPSTPKHILLYNAFGWSIPVFAHLPAVLAPGGGKKLSKRHGAKSALELRDEGYLPEAILNFLALLGWNPGEGSTQEVFSRDELIEQFSLERIQKSPAVFDIERLNWLNGVHIRTMSLPELLERSRGFWTPLAATSSDEYLLDALKLIQERLKTLAEIPDLTDFFFADPVIDTNLFSKIGLTEASVLLDEASRALAALPVFDEQNLESALRTLAEQKNVRTGTLFSTLRIAVTGKTAAPGIFETLSVLGKDTVLKRLNSAKEALKEANKAS